MNLKMIMILSSIFSNSSSVASLFPALNLESTCLAEKDICIQHCQAVQSAAAVSVKSAAPPTYELCWFVWPFVDERLEGLLHGIDKLLVLHEADVDDVIHLVLEVQQLLHHCLVFFRVDDDRAPECLRVGF